MEFIVILFSCRFCNIRRARSTDIRYMTLSAHLCCNNTRSRHTSVRTLLPQHHVIPTNYWLFFLNSGVKEIPRSVPCTHPRRCDWNWRGDRSGRIGAWLGACPLYCYRGSLGREAFSAAEVERHGVEGRRCWKVLYCADRWCPKWAAFVFHWLTSYVVIHCCRSRVYDVIAKELYVCILWVGVLTFVSILTFERKIVCILYTFTDISASFIYSKSGGLLSYE